VAAPYGYYIDRRGNNRESISRKDNDMGTTSLSLHGIFPPIPTPFTTDGEVAYEQLTANLARWNRYDLTGYIVLGSNGEGVYLNEAEKVRVLERARAAIPAGRLLVAGTGCESTRETIALTRQAAQVGADAALVLTPHYYGGKMTPDALVHHFHAVAEGSPIPVLLYNMPLNTHIDMDAATILRASRHPNVVGIKDSGGNVTKVGDVVRQVEPGFQVLAGSAGFLFPFLTMGAVGGVLALANVAPDKCLEIYTLYKAGKWDEAAALQRKMIPVNAAVTARFGVAGLKAALDMLGYYGGPVRSPLLELNDTERQALREILVAGDILG
jgi:4-hydroxy-2-oxoglutarate aldolase